MSRDEMVTVLAEEYRVAYARQRRLAQAGGVRSAHYSAAEGKVDGIVVAAHAIGISFYEIEEEAAK